MSRLDDFRYVLWCMANAKALVRRTTMPMFEQSRLSPQTTSRLRLIGLMAVQNGGWGK